VSRFLSPCPENEIRRRLGLGCRLNSQFAAFNRDSQPSTLWPPSSLANG
jgi:hypothetical protein